MTRRFNFLLCCLFVLCCASSLTAQEYDTDLLTPEFYRSVRAKFLKELPDSSIAIFFSADPKNRSNDTDYLFRQDNSMLYLTGCREDNAALILSTVPMRVGDKTATELVFVQRRDAARETWTGKRLGVEGALKTLGIASAATTDSLTGFLETLLADKRINTVYLTKYSAYSSTLTASKAQLAVEAKLQANVATVKEVVPPIKKLRNAKAPTLPVSAPALPSAITIKDATPFVKKLRMMKAPEELALIKKATDISVLAHKEAIAACRAGMYEYELAALVEYIFKKNGCEYTAYPSIVGAGENSVILHYETVRKKMMSGEMVVMDVGGEYHGYATDITRSFPVNGKFSAEQRAVYELVLAAQDSAIKECKPNNFFRAPHLKAVEIISEGLVKLGITASKDEYRKYFMHGTSHGVGLDVHDPGIAVLQEGNVLTVEPGIYIASGSPCDKKWWNIGVRFEDVVAVTADGYKVLSGDLPRKPDEIEQLMAKKKADGSR